VAQLSWARVANGSVTLASGSLIGSFGSTADGTFCIRAPIVTGVRTSQSIGQGAKLSPLSGVYVSPFNRSAVITGGTGPIADDYTRIQSRCYLDDGGASGNISNRLSSQWSPHSSILGLQ